MKLDLNLSWPEGVLLGTAAHNLSLPLVVNYSEGGRSSSIEIPDEALEKWWKSRLELSTEMYCMGARKYSMREGLLNKLWAVLHQTRKRSSSAIQSVLRREV